MAVVFFLFRVPSVNLSAVARKCRRFRTPRGCKCTHSLAGLDKPGPEAYCWSMKHETYRRRPAAQVKGTCKVCAHARLIHTFAWPIGCPVVGCNCPHVFVEGP